MIEEKKLPPPYRFIKWLVRVLYPKTAVVGAENLPDEPCIVIGNHSQVHGPIACELYFPGMHYTWCAGQMMHLREVPGYAYQDFWSQKPRYIRWFFRLASYVIAPLSVCVFNGANCIGVYHDTRILSTFKETVKTLSGGANVIIFPEHDVPYNDILCDLQNRFVDVARLYYKRTGKALAFVPLYVAPALHTLYLGKPTRFRPDAPIEEERRRICGYAAEEITAMARSLPRHTVVPYRNIPKRDYPVNVPSEVFSHEETDR